MILLKDGTSCAYGTVEEVQEQFGGTVIHVEHNGIIPPSDAYWVTIDQGGRAELEVANDADLAGILRTLINAGLDVRRFVPTRKSLDDIFIEVYGDEKDTVA